MEANNFFYDLFFKKILHLFNSQLCDILSEYIFFLLIKHIYVTQVIFLLYLIQQMIDWYEIFLDNV